MKTSHFDFGMWDYADNQNQGSDGWVFLFNQSGERTE